MISNTHSPHSSRYGQHLNLNQITSMVAPAETTIQKISTWLQSYGVRADDIVVHPSRDFMSVVTTVSVVESLLNIQMQEYVHEDTYVATSYYDLKLSNYAAVAIVLFDRWTSTLCQLILLSILISSPILGSAFPRVQRLLLHRSAAGNPVRCKLSLSITYQTLPSAASTVLQWSHGAHQEINNTQRELFLDAAMEISPRTCYNHVQRPEIQLLILMLYQPYVVRACNYTDMNRHYRQETLSRVNQLLFLTVVHVKQYWVPIIATMS